ncbi:MFS transporter [Bosea thiooxidans]
MKNVNQHPAAAAFPAARIPVAAYALCLCIAVIGSNSLVLGPIAPQVAESFGRATPAVMTASGAFGIGTALAAILLGRLIDRFGAGLTLRAALCLFTLALAASAVAPALPVLVAAQFVAGLAAGVALPSIYTLAAAVAPARRESDTIGIVLSGWTLSMVAGVSLSAVMADSVGWRFVYAFAAVAGTFALLVAMMMKLRGASAASTTSSPLAALRVSGVVPLLIACAGFMASFYGVYAYIGDHLHRALGLSLSANGLLALTYGLGFGAAAFLDGLIDRFDAGRFLPAMFLAVGGVYLVMGAASGSYVLTLAAVFFWGLANHFALNVLILRLGALDPARRGAVMGLNSGVTYLALFLGTASFGSLYAATEFAILPIAAAGLMLLAALSASLARSKAGGRVTS